MTPETALQRLLAAAPALAGYVTPDAATRTAYTLGARPVDPLHVAAPELLDVARQYVNDMRYPPQPDSRQRRIEWAQRVIAKAEGGE